MLGNLDVGVIGVYARPSSIEVEELQDTGPVHGTPGRRPGSGGQVLPGARELERCDKGARLPRHCAWEPTAIFRDSQPPPP